MIGAVTDSEIPDDLIQLKRDHVAVQDEIAALADTMPKSTDIVAGVAKVSPEQQAQWSVLHDRLGTLTERIHRHPAFENLDQIARYKLDAAASKAARTTSD